MDESENGFDKKYIKWIVMGSVFVLVFFLALAQCKIIGAGQRGVVLTWGHVGDVVWNEGLHFKVPISQKVVKIDIKIKKVQESVEAASKDLQDVKTDVALNYHPIPNKVGVLYQTVGNDFEQIIVMPKINEVTKATTALFTAEELITKRENVKSTIYEGLKEVLLPFNIQVDEFSIINFKFSPEFQSAIEAKQTAQQNVLKATQDLARIKIEADQKVASANADAQSTILNAKAQAESLAIQRQQVTPEMIRFRAVEKWDGKLPTYMGSGPVPFLSVGQ